MPGSGSAKPLPAKLAARAFWLPITGPAANNTIIPAMTMVPNVIIVFDFAEVRNIFSTSPMVLILFICRSYLRRMYYNCESAVIIMTLK